MNLLILRHAVALDRIHWRRADADRPLTEDGIKKMKKVAKGIRKSGIEFDWILTSPYRRAYQTAEIVADEYKDRAKLRVSKSLTPDGDPKPLVRHLALDFRSWETVMLVGHEPYLSQLVSMLVAGNSLTQIELKKGGLGSLISDSLTYGQCATLQWLFTPKQLRKMG